MKFVRYTLSLSAFSIANGETLSNFESSSSSSNNNNNIYRWIKPVTYRRVKKNKSQKSPKNSKTNKSSKKSKNRSKGTNLPSATSIKLDVKSSSGPIIKPIACMKPTTQSDYVLIGDISVLFRCVLVYDAVFNVNNIDFLTGIVDYYTEPCLAMGSKVLIDTAYSTPQVSSLKALFADTLKVTLDNEMGTGTTEINDTDAISAISLDVSIFKTLIMFAPVLPADLLSILGNFMKEGGRVIFIGDSIVPDSLHSVNSGIDSLGSDTKFASTRVSLPRPSFKSGGMWTLSDGSTKSICMANGVLIDDSASATVIVRYNDATTAPLVVADNIDRS